MSDQLRCTGCGATLYSGPPDCPLCGAPNCCPQCCKIADLQSRLTAAETRVKELELINLRIREYNANADIKIKVLRAELDKLKGTK